MIAESINFSFLFFLLGLKCGCKFGGSVSHGTKWMAELVHNQYGGMASLCSKAAILVLVLLSRQVGEGHGWVLFVHFICRKLWGHASGVTEAATVTETAIAYFQGSEFMDTVADHTARC